MGRLKLRVNSLEVIALLLFGMVIALTGNICADQPVPVVPETQALSTLTTADVVGLAIETDAGTWTITSGGIPLSPTDPSVANWPGWEPGDYNAFLYAYNEALAIAPGLSLQDFINYEIQQNPNTGVKNQMKALNSYLSGGGGLHNPPLYSGEVRYTTAYDANILAQAGHTVLTKSMNIDTRNKVITQSNLFAKTGLTFAATADGGNVVGSENLMIDGAGMNTTASDRMLCPFASQPIDQIPAFCNIVQAGSTYDLTIGSVTTHANDRFISSDATNPVVLNYDISVKPYGTTQGQISATGSAMAYLKAHIQESRRTNTSQASFTYGPATITGSPLKAEDLTYNEQSSAQGTITAFTKVIAYQSGKSLL